MSSQNKKSGDFDSQATAIFRPSQSSLDQTFSERTVVAGREEVTKPGVPPKTKPAPVKMVGGDTNPGWPTNAAGATGTTKKFSLPSGLNRKAIYGVSGLLACAVLAAVGFAVFRASRADQKFVVLEPKQPVAARPIETPIPKKPEGRPAVQNSNSAETASKVPTNVQSNVRASVQPGIVAGTASIEDLLVKFDQAFGATQRHTLHN